MLIPISLIAALGYSVYHIFKNYRNFEPLGRNEAVRQLLRSSNTVVPTKQSDIS
jgi:hypothetical protein